MSARHGAARWSPYPASRSPAPRPAAPLQNRAGHDHPVAQPAERFSSFNSIGALVYARTAIALETIGNVWGHDALERALESYTRRERFRHPGPSFLEDVRTHLGSDAHDALSAALFDKGWVDYELADLDCVQRRAECSATAPSGPRSPATAPSRGRVGRWSVARARCASRSTWSWSSRTAPGSGAAGRPAKTGLPFDAAGPSEVVAAVVNPDRNVLLDENLGNNSRRKRGEFGHRTLERMTYAVQLALGLMGGIDALLRPHPARRSCRGLGLRPAGARRVDPGQPPGPSAEQHGRPRGDAILFDAGGLELIESLRLSLGVLGSELKGALLIGTVLGALVIPAAALLAALVEDRAQRAGRSVRRAVTLFPRFVLSFGARLFLQGAVLAVGALALGRLGRRLASSWPEQSADLSVLGRLGLLVLAASALGIYEDLFRVESARGATLGRALRGARCCGRAGWRSGEAGSAITPHLQA